jgi:glycosyltransferase involved in cell wall biosynthesis
VSTAEPAVTVVVPAHNTGATIEATLRSVLRQSLRQFEVIVVDDGSTDDTADRVRGFQADPRIRLIQQRNAGPSAARNAGIAAASASTISVLDSDDLWLPTYLEKMTAAVASRPDAGFAYTDAWLFDDGRRLLSSRSAMGASRSPAAPPTAPHEFLLALLDRNFVYTSATIRRDVLIDVGGYDERLRYGEDFELWARIVQSGRAPVCVPGRLAVHRRHPSSLTSDVRRFYAGVCQTYGIILAEHPLDDDAGAIVRRRLDYWAHHLAQLDAPRPRARARRAVRRLPLRLLERRRWLQSIPEPVATTLADCGVM